MGKKIDRTSSSTRSKTLPSSPSHSFSSSSSSDFEFRISVSPRKSSASLCPADELFYKGQLLPLHLSTRISMVRTLLLSSSSTSSSATATASRDSSSSTDSSTSDFSLLAPGDPCCDSSRPSDVTDDDDPLKRLNPINKVNNNNSGSGSGGGGNNSKSFTSSRYFSFARMFKKDGSKATNTAAESGKKMSSSAKEMIRKYLRKVKPLYEKLSQKHQQQQTNGGRGVGPTERSFREVGDNTRVNIAGSSSGTNGNITFSGSLKYCPRMIRRSYVASCPSSMRSSPSHSGVLTRGGLPARVVGSGSGTYSSDTATMEELQNAIQGAIAHCKNSMLQQNSAGFNYQSNNNYKGKAIVI